MDTAAVRACAITDCKKPPRPRRPVCSMHEARIRRHGSPEPDVHSHVSSDERFDMLVERGQTCWIWQGSLSTSGYGRMRVRRKYIAAHRYAYERFVGPIPGGLVVMHRCDTPACVNPAHLMIGTHADNMRDMASKNRGNGCRPGERHPSTRIPEAVVAEIRRLAAGGSTIRDLHETFGVSLCHTRSIVAGTRRRIA